MNKLMAAVAVCGPFKPDAVEATIDPNSEEAVQPILEEALKFSLEQYGKEQFYWVTLSVQLGFGRYVMHFCKRNKLKLISIDAMPVYIPSPNKYTKVPFGSKEDLVAVFQCRNASIIELADCFFVKLNKSSYRTVIDDLVDRIKRTDKPFFIYGEDNSALEYKGDPKIGAKKEEKI